MNTYLLAASLGGLIAFAAALPATVLEIAERGKVNAIPLLVDVKTIFGRKLTRWEIFLTAVLLHIILGTAFGAIYVLFVEHGWLVVTHAPYTFLSLVVYAVGAWIVTGALLFPVLGMGWFGRREGKRIWVEILASMFINGIGFWLLVQWFRPWFFGA